MELGFGVGHGFCLPEGLRRFYIFVLRRTAEKIGARGDPMCDLSSEGGQQKRVSRY
jgi:hypothetical protein